MSGLRRSLARGGAHSMVPLSRQGGGRAALRAGGAFSGGQKGKEGTPLPDENYTLEPGGSGPSKTVAMTMRLSEDVKAALTDAQKEGLAVQLKFGANAQSHVSIMIDFFRTADWIAFVAQEHVSQLVKSGGQLESTDFVCNTHDCCTGAFPAMPTSKSTP